MAEFLVSGHGANKAVQRDLSAALSKLGARVHQPETRHDHRALVDQCDAVIVVWSAKSVANDVVLEDASLAMAQGKLCAVRIDGARLPPVFQDFAGRDFQGWCGDETSPQFRDLANDLHRCVRARGAEQPEPEPEPAVSLTGQPMMIIVNNKMRGRPAIAANTQRRRARNHATTQAAWMVRLALTALAASLLWAATAAFPSALA
ncbi:MAG: hypothetical protein WDM79_06495 [Terricaulis sp.]